MHTIPQAVFWRFDADLALTRTRFRGNDSAQQFPTWLALAGYPEAQIGNAPGNFIPEAPNMVASLGVEVGEDKGWFGSLLVRYLGKRPLTEDGAFVSPSTTTLNARVGYRFDNGIRIQLDGLNLTNSHGDQISYAYGSFLRTDALFQSCAAGVPPAAVCSTGVMNRVLHPIEPLAFRLSIAGNFLTWALKSGDRHLTAYGALPPRASPRNTFAIEATADPKRTC